MSCCCNSCAQRGTPCADHEDRVTDRYRIELRPIGGKRWANVAPMARLRLALKALARTYGLRVVSCTREGDR